MTRAERRALKKQRREENRNSASGMKNFAKWLWILLVVAAIGGIAVWIATGFLEEKPGTKVAIQSREHVNPGTAHDPYTSEIPVSGPHYPEWSTCGIFEEELAVETLIHNMEHGHVIVWYKPELAAEQKDRLKKFVENRLSNRNILMAPRKDLSANIAFASWGWFQTFDAVDEEAMADFYKSHKYRGPERVPCELED